MRPKNPSHKLRGRLPDDSAPSLATDGDNARQRHLVSEAGHAMRIEQAEARTERAEARAEQAEGRAEQARSRTEQAEGRTEQAETRTEHAKTRTEEAETRTERAESRSDLAIRASELSYRRLFEAAQDGILILDADTGKISDANPFLSKMLGFSRDDLVSKFLWELGPLADIMSNKAKFEELQQEGFVRYDNLPLEAKGGEKIAVEFVSNVYQAGHCDVIQCNVREITERKRAQERMRSVNAELERRVLERTAQLQSVNEELEMFSYSVSHDLRAPLRHIMGFVGLLEKDAGPSLSEKSLSHLATVFQAAKRMGNLIDDLLAFAHVGHSDLRKSAVDLDVLVRGTVAGFRADTADRKIAWEIGDLPEVRADAALLEMALVNLISNAIKFTRGRTEAKIEIGCAPGGDCETVIFIRDNGAGFDPKFSQKLFGVFQRLHSQEEFEGTGIGLANVQRIIQRHGGRTWAEGVVNGGATFYFSLPKEAVAQ